MARERKPMEDLSAQAKQAVEETKEQALGAADTYFGFLNKTVASFPSGGTDFGEKLKSYAERNIAATHEFIKQLSSGEGLSRRAWNYDRVYAGANAGYWGADKSLRRGIYKDGDK